jgi:hypothetical protein
LKLIVALSPAVLVLALTLVISFVSGHPAGLFFTNSIRGIPARFVVATLALILPLWILPAILGLTGKIVKNNPWLGQFVMTTTSIDQDLGIPNAWILRPVQGMSVSLIFAERFLSFLESSISVSYTALLLLLLLFVIGGVLTSLFLSIIWALDDLGVRIYSGKTGEVRMAGTTVGTIFPLIAGAIGVAGLFHASLPSDALIDLLEIVTVLYPPYVVFTVIHHEFVKRRSSILRRKLVSKRIETRVR